MKKILAMTAAAALTLPTVGSAGGIDPVIITTTTPPPPVVARGSLGAATPWIIAGVAIGLIALAASDGSDD